MADSIMDSLIYSLNATVPVFVVIVVGYLLKRIGWINQGFIEASNKINFKVIFLVIKYSLIYRKLCFLIFLFIFFHFVL